MAGGAYAVRIVGEDRQPVEEDIQITNTAPVLERRYILKPLTSVLRIRTIPAGGQLLVDGRRVPESGEIEVTANEDHTVTYVRPGYRFKSETVRLTSKEQRELTMQLQEELGVVDIRTTAGADIHRGRQEGGNGQRRAAAAGGPAQDRVAQKGLSHRPQDGHTIRPSVVSSFEKN